MSFEGSTSLPAPPVVRYRTDFDKQVLFTNFSSRSFKRTEDERTEWNFAWMTVGNVRAMFNPETGWRLNDAQMVNHFPNHYELTRKDLMVKNLKVSVTHQQWEPFVATQEISHQNLWLFTRNIARNLSAKAATSQRRTILPLSRLQTALPLPPLQQ